MSLTDAGLIKKLYSIWRTTLYFWVVTFSTKCQKPDSQIVISTPYLPTLDQPRHILDSITILVLARPASGGLQTFSGISLFLQEAPNFGLPLIIHLIYFIKDNKQIMKHFKISFITGPFSVFLPLLVSKFIMQLVKGQGFKKLPCFCKHP